MDKNFIEKNNLSEAVERFRTIAEYKSPRQSLNEYTFVTAAQVTEDGQEDGGEMQQPNDGMNQQQNVAPDAQNQGGAMNGQMNQQMPPEGTEMPQNGDMGDMPAADGGQQDMSMGDMSMADGQEGGDMGDMDVPQVEDDGIETEEMEPDDEVIDVDELTQSQEATEYKIDGVDDRLAKIFDVVQKFSEKLDNQEQSIIDLKTEFEKRNPTPEEKLNIRSQSTYPYCETPKGYWAEKVKENPNYNVMYDNDVSTADEQDKFEIKKSDISGLNMRDISDSLDIDQNLKDYIGF